MKLFSVTFEGFYPTGNCLIIKAENKEEAEDIAAETLTHTDKFKVSEVNMDTPGVVIYLSGDN